MGFMLKKEMLQARAGFFLRIWDIGLASLICAVIFALSSSQLIAWLNAPLVPNAASTATGLAAVPFIQAAGLFGRPSAQEPQDAAATALELRGIIEGTDAASSYAIIAVAGQAEKSYRVGDTLPDGSRVDSILAKEVVLSGNGSRRNLSMKQKK